MSRAPETFPHDLSKREREILALLLSVDVPGIDELRQQAEAATVSGRCSCGCATVDFTVDQSMAPASPLRHSPVIETRTKAGVAGEAEPRYDLLLFLDNGWLQSVEIVYYGDTIPSEFPPPEDFEPPRLRPADSA